MPCDRPCESDGDCDGYSSCQDGQCVQRGCPPCPCCHRGACCKPGECLPDKTCDECYAECGEWYGRGTSCEEANCLPACSGECYEDGDCGCGCSCIDGVCLTTPCRWACCVGTQTTECGAGPLPGCFSETQDECEECLCYDHADWVEVECSCDGSSVSCPECPEGYASNDIVNGDCDGPPLCPGDPGKRLCVRKLDERPIVPCCEVAVLPPQNCLGEIVNPAEHYSGGCGTFYPARLCDYEELGTVSCEEVGGLSLPLVKKAPDPGGPGTELKALLAKIGIHASPTCKCNSMAKKMDQWGPEESLNHIEEIVDVMAETAKKRNLPFLRTAGRILVRQACRISRKKGNGK